ncbi:MarR family winged helix-turn-helix transcriptional regulator [Sporosarcina obsidiansis]|uniref:MarR family winged helix-turn-helix transcriptional regulator n=1 Tax=Sporosarcina obsidiansis TaxID=2660748 RepID=UPI00129ACE46|nr:MarR family transcriptional regulator [Sporosarcina obsidiansis]
MNPLFHVLFQKTRFISKDLNVVLKEYGLFATQWTVLYCVRHWEEVSLTDIWQYLHVEAPTITRTVNRMEELGWLQTMPGKDRREKIVRLTEKAEKEFPAIEQSIIEFEQEFLTQLSKEEQETLLALLQKLDKKEGNRFA